MSGTPIEWDDLLVDVGPEGGLRLRREGEIDALAGFRVDWPDPWRRVDRRVGADEVREEMAAPGGHAVVRQVFSSLWHLSVDVDVEPGASLPAPLLVASPGPAASGPPWLLGAGILGMIAWWSGTAGLIALSQAEGRCRPAEAPDGPALRCWSAATIHGPAHLRSRWRGEPFPGVAEVRSLLPPWLPESTAVQAGEEIELDLPDAAVSTGQHRTDGLASIVTVPPGSGRIDIETARGPVILDTWGSGTLGDEVAGRARRALAGDPRALTGAQLWIAAHDPSSSGETLRAGAEELVARQSRHRAPDPFALAAASSVLGGDEGVPEELEQIAARWLREPRPGCWLASAWIQHLTGRRTGLPEAGVDPLDLLERAVVLGDADAARPAVEWAVRVLGAGLPGTPVAEAPARAAGLLSVVPAAWTARFPELPGIVTHWQHRILSGDDESAAWLLW